MNKTTALYIIFGVVTLGLYPFAAHFLGEQYAVYKLYEGNPLTMLFVFGIYGWWADYQGKKSWPNSRMKRLALLWGGILAITLILRFIMGFDFNIF